MKHLVIIAFMALFSLISCRETTSSTSAIDQDFTQFVDSFIGTGGHGHTFPGATRPFGMVQLSPDTRLDGWDGCSGYHFSDSVVYGFSHTHLSGTGVSDYGDVLLLPSTSFEYSAHFDKTSEIAAPGYYSMYLDEQKIKVELTSSLRAGFHKYTFQPTDTQFVWLDLNHRDLLISHEMTQVSNTEITGHRVSKAWAQEQHIYYAIEFSKPIGALVFGPERKDAWIEFKDLTSNELLVKVGISAVSVENAKQNLSTEIPHWDFEKTKSEAESDWNNQLSKIEVKGTEDDQVKFYTALYHTMIAPNIYSDVNGDYRGMDMKIHNIEDGKEQYTVFSLWDTYRATHPLYTIIEQERTTAFIQTFLRQHRQGGLLPVWELAANETNCMIGYHSIPVIADAYLKGIRGYDENQALDAMVHSANQDHFGLEFYKKQGFINAGDEPESVSKTLEYAYDDWCIAEMSSAMGHNDLAQEFYERSENWKNLYDAEFGFFRARVNNMRFSPFRPDEVNFNYTEANAWQYSLYVPHDIYGLQKLKPAGLEPHLNLLFSVSSETSGRNQADITGLIGQYAHGNEPSHHMAYLYNYCGRPDKTQKLVTQIKETLYTTKPDGLSGNEDCGQMSAWYVLSAMGFYPVTPGQSYYAIGSPTFKEVVIHLENGKTFTIKANNLREGFFKIHSATLNGLPFEQTYLNHESIINGGELIFEMGQGPSNWGKDESFWPPQTPARNNIVPVPFFTNTVNTFEDTLRVKINALCTECEIYTMTKTGDERTHWIDIDSVELNSDAGVWAFALHPDGRSSDTIFTQFYKLDPNIKLTLHSSYANQYAAGGEHALIDKQFGGSNFRTGYWQGYQEEDFKATLDLEKSKNGAQIQIGFLQDIKSWIWYPEKVIVTVYDSENGSKQYEVFPGKGLEKTEGALQTKAIVHHSGPIKKVTITAKNRGPCPEWHLGAGGKSWIFIDEIEVISPKDL